MNKITIIVLAVFAGFYFMAWTLCRAAARGDTTNYEDEYK